MPPPGIVLLGLVTGALAAFNSLGIILLWRTTRIVNLAQPSIGLVGGVLAGLLITSAGWSFWWAAPIGLMVGALLGLATNRFVLRRLQEAPRSVLLVATIGLAAIFGSIQTGLPFAFAGRPLPTYNIDLGFSMQVAGQELPGAHILVLITLPIVLAATYWFLYRTKFGLSALALGQDQERARALGVSSSTVRSAVWAVAGTIGTISGIFVIPVMGFQLGGVVNATVLLLALAPAVFAGLRSLAGATIGAVLLGVAFQSSIFYVNRAGLRQLLLAGAVLLAVAIQRRRLGRQESAFRASSWEAAATPRPLAHWVRRSTGVRAASLILSLGAIGVAAWFPFTLSPSRAVAYGNIAAVTLAVLAVAVAWMFAGEVSLGHWGFAGLGAAITAVTPGPWMARVAAGAVAMTLVGAILGLVSRRQSSLSFAVLGLAAAAAGPVAILAVTGRLVIADLQMVAAVSGALTVTAAVGVTWMRGSVVGVRLVAARDDPFRGPWLGAAPAPARVLALAISIGMAGLAGGLYAASSPVGLVAGSSSVVGAFDFSRSLDLLTMAVIGGLGSPAGVLISAAGIQLGRLVLPQGWVLLVSGVGIMFVVIFQPAGLSRLLSFMRLKAGGFLAGNRGEGPAPA